MTLNKQAKGLGMPPVSVPPNVKEATVPLEGADMREGQTLILEVVSEKDGSVIAESSPILIEARKQ